MVTDIVIKPGPGLIRPRGRIPGFIGQPGKLKKIKVLIFYMKKSM
jgi:hypothetical protein